MKYTVDIKLDGNPATMEYDTNRSGWYTFFKVENGHAVSCHKVPLDLRTATSFNFLVNGHRYESVNSGN
jgi:hypothetical protein